MTISYYDYIIVSFKLQVCPGSAQARVQIGDIIYIHLNLNMISYRCNMFINIPNHKLLSQQNEKLQYKNNRILTLTLNRVFFSILKMH